MIGLHFPRLLCSICIVSVALNGGAPGALADGIDSVTVAPVTISDASIQSQSSQAPASAGSQTPPPHAGTLDAVDKELRGEMPPPEQSSGIPFTGAHLGEDSTVIGRGKRSRKNGQAAVVAGQDSNLVGRRSRKLFMVLKVKELSPYTRELAEQLEILPDLEELYNPNQEHSAVRTNTLREDVMETILESYFDAASVVAEAEREQARLEVLRESMINRRDKSVELNNATNFIASGTLNTIGSVLGFPRNAAPFPGNLNQMLSGVVAAGLSMYALKQNSGGKITGWAHPTIVSELFGRPVDERTVYPESVWRFMHGHMPAHANYTRAQWLEQLWIQNQHLEPHGSKREQRKIDLVCGVQSGKADVSIDDISDQITIISDLSAAASQMIHHLRDLMRMADSDAVR